MAKYVSAALDDDTQPTKVVVVDNRGNQHVFGVQRKARGFRVGLPLPEDDSPAVERADEELQSLIRGAFGEREVELRREF